MSGGGSGCNISQQIQSVASFTQLIRFQAAARDVGVPPDAVLVVSCEMNGDLVDLLRWSGVSGEYTD